MNVDPVQRVYQDALAAERLASDRYQQRAKVHPSVWLQDFDKAADFSRRMAEEVGLAKATAELRIAESALWTWAKLQPFYPRPGTGRHTDLVNSETHWYCPAARQTLLTYALSLTDPRLFDD